MTYLPGIPSNTASQFRTNFTALDNIFANNHYKFDDPTVANRGFHKFSTYVEQGAGPATAAGMIALYCKSYGSQDCLYFRRPGSGAEILLTGPSGPVQAANGYTFVPGGILIQWGKLIAVPIANTNYSFNIHFSGNVYQVFVTPISNSASNQPTVCWTGTPAAGSFNVRRPAGTLEPATVDVSWFAIGPA